LTEESDHDFPLNLGDYIYQYRDALEVLIMVTVLIKERDAMRLFRDVNDITGIPQIMVEEFLRHEVCCWVKIIFLRLNYAELATLPFYPNIWLHVHITQ
jgi:hypothetical protein